MNKDCCEQCRSTWKYKLCLQATICPCHKEEGDWRERFDKEFGRVEMYYYADGAYFPIASDIKAFIEQLLKEKNK